MQDDQNAIEHIENMFLYIKSWPQAAQEHAKAELRLVIASPVAHMVDWKNRPMPSFPQLKPKPVAVAAPAPPVWFPAKGKKARARTEQAPVMKPAKKAKKGKKAKAEKAKAEKVEAVRDELGVFPRERTQDYGVRQRGWGKYEARAEGEPERAFPAALERGEVVRRPPREKALAGRKEVTSIEVPRCPFR